MNPLHLEILTRQHIAARQYEATGVRLQQIARAASQPKPDEDGPLHRRMPRGPRLRVPAPLLGRSVRSLRMLFGGALA